MRCRKGRKANTSFLIIDAQSVGNTDTAKHGGFDAGKKVSGIKRHIEVDRQGLPHFIAVTTAEFTDRQGALAGMRGQRQNLAEVTTVLADGDYRDKPFAQSIKQLLGAEVTVAKRNDCISLPSFRNAGWWKGVSPGSESVDGFGKTVKTFELKFANGQPGFSTINAQ